MQLQDGVCRSAALLLLSISGMVAGTSHAQNQTAANVPMQASSALPSDSSGASTPAYAPQSGGDDAGIWRDNDTGLNWTQSDNGQDVNWDQALSYCKGLRLGGFSDWRLPEIDDLKQIDDPLSPGHLKGPLQLTGQQWSATEISNGAAYSRDFRFSSQSGFRALCVRRSVIGVAFKDTFKDGVRVQRVASGGPAERAGIKSGDTILTIDGRNLSSNEDFVNDISPRRPGSSATLDVRRNGTVMQFTVTIASN
ncbi:MAG: PDZ domain-containing protein [Terracidiphilus sp.]